MFIILGLTVPNKHLVIYPVLVLTFVIVNTVYNRGHRAILAKFRSGIFPFSIESGRFQNIPRECRLCRMCNDNVIEDETHFIFYCNQYNDMREYLYKKICPQYQHFEIPSDAEKLIL